jgi:ABC-type multidrug transport system fused ATPase/permease subunit
MSFHNDRSPGELIERIEGDVSEFSNFFSQLVIRVIGNILLLIGILVALFITNRQLGLSFTIFAVIAVVVLNRIRGVAVPYRKAFRDADTELFGFLEERLAGTEDIRSCGAVDFVLRELFSLQANIYRRWKIADLMMLCVSTTAGLLMAAGFGLAFASAYHLYRSGFITVGIAYMIIHYTNLLARPIRELSRQVESMQNIGAYVQRMGELLTSESKIKDGPGIDLPAIGPLRVEFNDVSFAYAEDKPVLHGLSFALEPGRVLGLLGRTGSGKTTLARLIFRLYDAESGAVMLDGKDIRMAKLPDLRERVALVTQDVQLFQASVRDNITFFDHKIPNQRIQEVIEALELSDWYNGLPDGLDTMLETGGRSLSAGEAQLLAFTRVFLRDPGLVILDEASSRLDPATERLVERAIDKLLANRTAIIIAHRLGTVERADDILIIEEGKAIEHGNRLGLLEDPMSRFSQLQQTGLEGLLA